ncbi:hypothetical protein DLM85_04300 [Hymenobacter edaphi]|uniref:Outer membrane protein beta-barrel domain-containing protein n=1 Tax=Hymenobacter edaphi TaxID=2211146 RepID=A0A328BS20_9BACT|nr:hypothetical protein DLM85_04300 [Hymenobacter edaphi]
MLLLAAAPAAAQQSSEAAAPAPPAPRQALKLGVFSSETIGLSYERQLAPRYSLQAALGGWFTGYDGGRGFVYDSAYSYYIPTQRFRARGHRLALTAQVRRYLQPPKPALAGWYVGAGAQLLGQWTRYRFDDGHTERRRRREQALQLRLGRQCQLGPRFTFDASLGPELVVGTEPRYAYNSNTGLYAPTAERYFYARPSFGLALQAGYRF